MLTLGKGVKRSHLLDLSQRPNQTLSVWFAQIKTIGKKNRCRVSKASIYLLHCLWTSYREERAGNNQQWHGSNNQLRWMEASRYGWQCERHDHVTVGGMAQ